MKHRLTALLLLAGVVAAVAFDRAQPRFISTQASIHAPTSHPLELPPAITTGPVVVRATPVATSFLPPASLAGVERSVPLYLHHRSLLL